jgi:hypothetical protein
VSGAEPTGRTSGRGLAVCAREKICHDMGYNVEKFLAYTASIPYANNAIFPQCKKK